MLAGGIVLLIAGLAMVFGLSDHQAGNVDLGNIGWIVSAGGVLMIVLYFVRRSTAPRAGVATTTAPAVTPTVATHPSVAQSPVVETVEDPRRYDV